MQAFTFQQKGPYKTIQHKSFLSVARLSYTYRQTAAKLAYVFVVHEKVEINAKPKGKQFHSEGFYFEMT